MALSVLAGVERVTIDPEVLGVTLSSLRECGKHGYEGLVLWLGEVHAKAACVSRVIVPDQKPISNESGVGYFVEGSTLFKLNRALALSGLRLIAQVHSHPTDAYHSKADDRYAIVTAEGGLSLVVPNFGNAPLDPHLWAIYRLTRGEWRELGAEESRVFITIGVPK